MVTEASAVDLAATGVDFRPLDPRADAGLAVDGILPRVLATPRDASELAAVLRYAAEHRLAVIPRGSGTKMALGKPPERADILLSTRALDHVVEYEPQDLTVTVQAGSTLAALQERLGMAQQYLPLDPPHAGLGTIGGMIATNASGPWRLGHGGLRDMLIGTRAVLPDGTVARAGGKVVKNVAGYDLNKLYIGSLGTLAVLLEATFKVAPLPAAATSVLAGFETAAEALTVAQRLGRSALMPRAIALVDPATAHTLSASLPAGAFALLVAFAGFPAVLKRQAADTEQHCRDARARAVQVLDDSEARDLWQAVEEFPAAEGHVVAKAALPPAGIKAMLEAASEAGRALGTPLAVVAHPGTGIVYLRVPAAVEVPAAGRTVGELRAACARLDGSLILWSADEALKRRLDPWGPSAYPVELMQRLKAQFDPQRVLNPGRYVGGI